MKNLKTLNKVDLATISIARDMLMLNLGDRVKSVKEYSENLLMSVGSIQKAFDILEKDNVIKLTKNGVFGKKLEYKDKNLLIEKSFLNYVVGVMPLPYSKRYEGLAMAIKSSFEKYGINFYFAYMQGSRVRLKLLENDVYDFAIMSNLAYVNLKNNNLKKVFSLGSGSYVSKHVLLSSFKLCDNIRVGIDKNSEDQYFLSCKYFDGKKYNMVDVNSDNIIKEIQNNRIDQAILSADEIEENLVSDINVNDIFDKEYINLANEAVIVIKRDNKLMESLVKQILNVENIREIQKKVLEKIIVPRY